MTPDAASLQHGRRGGGWAPKAHGPRQPQKSYVPAAGGPLADLEVRIDSFSIEPELVDVIPMAAGGCYRLEADEFGRHVYRWEPSD